MMCTRGVLLGILPLAPFNTLVVDPKLPAWLPDVTVHDLRVGSACVTLRCWRDAGGESHFEVVHQVGALHVVGQPPPESIAAGFGERVSDAFETIWRTAS